VALELTHWEHSFLLHTCNLGESVRTGTNPFTGEAVEFPVDDGLTDDEIDALQDAFDENGIDGPEPDGEGYAVYGDEGDCLRFRCPDLDDGVPITGVAAEITVRELSNAVLAVVLDVARAGNLALTSTVGDCVRIVDRPPDRKMLERWPDAQTLSSVADLRQWLQESVGGQRVHIPS
jgi:hypothetical protein